MVTAGTALTATHHNRDPARRRRASLMASRMSSWSEALRHNEPRRIDDTSAERRWPEFCRAASRSGFGSCLALPLRTDRHPPTWSRAG